MYSLTLVHNTVGLYSDTHDCIWANGFSHLQHIDPALFTIGYFFSLDIFGFML